MGCFGVLTLTPKVRSTTSQHALPLPFLHTEPLPQLICYAMWVQTSVYEVKSVGDITLEFGSEGVGVREVRWGEGEVCRTLKFWTPNFETTIQNILQRSNSLLPLFRPLKTIYPPQKSMDGVGVGSVVTPKQFNPFF